jgi:hypothetical protein
MVRRDCWKTIDAFRVVTSSTGRPGAHFNENVVVPYIQLTKIKKDTLNRIKALCIDGELLASQIF